MRPIPQKIADELIQFHEAQTARIRATIANATEDQQKHLERAAGLHEAKLTALVPKSN